MNSGQSQHPSTAARSPLAPWVHAATTLGWCLLLSALYVVDRSRPAGFKLDRFFGVSRRRIWDAEGLDTAFWLVVAALGLGVLALAIDLSRSSRERRPPSPATFALALVAVVGFLAHLMAFG
jgi:drug/metabolite transporter (DMT)-like permease